MAESQMSPEQLQALRAQMMQNSGGVSNPTPTQQANTQQSSPHGAPSMEEQQAYMQRQREQVAMADRARMQSMQMTSQSMSSAMPNPADVPMPNTVVQQTSGQRPTAQETMKARMQASRQQQNQQPQQTVMSQGEQYTPTQYANMQQPAQQSQRSEPIDQTAPNNGGGVQANQTIINTTQTEDDGNSGKGFKMNPVMAIGIAVVVLLLVFFGYSYVVKHGSGEEDTQPSDYDPFNDPNIEWIEPEQNYSYTIDEIQQLRAAGYTGDEIESYAALQTPYKDLIHQAEAARDAYIQQAIAPLYDTASDEYKHFIAQTWLTLPERTDTAEWQSIAMNYSERRNLDYEKIDVYGNQLFIKIYLDDNVHEDWFFCSVTPEEWNRLSDFGNIIVNYTYCTRYVGDDPWLAVEDTENIFIISASIEFVN